jgi:predicted nucleotidyltransferase component of viral defense system
MHVLYGLKNQGLAFELKGGTSLSKGYKIIKRFSEDIDIYIHPPLLKTLLISSARFAVFTR